MALEAVKEGRTYDVVLLDIQMPVMDGLTATANLRQAGYTQPIVALTAHNMQELEDRCLSIGCDAIAAKPIDRSSFLQILHHFANL